MESEILKRLDRMLTKHALLLAEIEPQRDGVPPELIAEINRLDKALYSLCEGVRGFLRARECGFPLEGFDSYMQSIEAVADQIDKSVSSHLSELEAFMKRREPR